jgi:cytochrome c oxidase subunit 3
MSALKSYQQTKHYFIAHPSFWPLVGSCGLFATVFGLVQLLHQGVLGGPVMTLGLVLILITMCGWFGAVIKESVQGLHSEQMDRTYRWGMVWFIVSELFLFGIFFGALFYTRIFTLTELSDTAGTLATFLHLSSGSATHQYLWPKFQYTWPLLTNPNPTLFPGPKTVLPTWGIPALNTGILLSSAVAVTWAHGGLRKNKRGRLLLGLIITIILGCIFESFQMYEYHHAYTEFGLTLSSGIYGSTFYTLTGLHAAHVTIGVIMLTIIFIRCLLGHFSLNHHFAFEAACWYWHFVDVVWLFLFVFVYWF